MKRTSRVFACWEHLHSIVAGAAWTPHPMTGEVPPVLFGDAVEVPNECVIVVGVPADRPTADWATMGTPSQDEDFTLQVWVSTRVPGLDRQAAFARLEELCDLIQTVLRDPVTGRPAGGFTTAVEGVLWHRVTSVAPQLLPMTEGFGGFADIDISFHARL